MLALIILSIIQGLTEFLPVSSSGHLVIAKEWLGFHEHGLEMELWLHVATLVALVVYFRDDIFALFGSFFKKDGNPVDKKWVWLILLSTVITGVVGVVFRKALLGTFEDLRLTYIGFIVTAIILLATPWTREKREEITYLDAVLFGLVQAFSILPSISRSGATIALLLLLGIHRGTAFRFSFIASIPAILGAFLLEVGVGSFSIFTPLQLAVTFVVTFIFGLLSLAFLRQFVVQQKFYYFGFYCLAIGVIGLIFF